MINGGWFRGEGHVVIFTYHTKQVFCNALFGYLATSLEVVMGETNFPAQSDSYAQRHVK